MPRYPKNHKDVEYYVRCNGGQVRKELTKCLFSEPPTEPAMQGLSAT